SASVLESTSMRGSGCSPSIPSGSNGTGSPAFLHWRTACTASTTGQRTGTGDEERPFSACRARREMGVRESAGEVRHFTPVRLCRAFLRGLGSRGDQKTIWFYKLRWSPRDPPKILCGWKFQGGVCVGNHPAAVDATGNRRVWFCRPARGRHFY